MWNRDIWPDVPEECLGCDTSPLISPTPHQCVGCDTYPPQLPPPTLNKSDEHRDILDDITLDWLNDDTLSVVDFMKRCKVCGIDVEGMKRAYDKGESTA